MAAPAATGLASPDVFYFGNQIAETGDSSEALERLRSLVDWFPSTLDVPILAECRALLG